MRAVVRAVTHRVWSLLCVGLLVGIAAAFAAMTTVIWSPGLPHAARDDLRDSAQAGVVVELQSPSADDVVARTRIVDSAVSQSGAPSAFTVATVLTSNVLALSTKYGKAGDFLTVATSSASMRAHTELVTGHWPTPVSSGSDVEALLPASVMGRLKLHVGDDLRLTDTTTKAEFSVDISGSFRRSASEPAYWLWDHIGGGGVSIAGPYTSYGPLIIDGTAFRLGPLVTGRSSWVVTPTGPGGDFATVMSATPALLGALPPQPGHGVSVSTTLPSVLKQLDARVIAGRAQLLTDSLLIAVLAGSVLAAAASHLVAHDAAQQALLRSRGARRRNLVARFWPDVVVLCGFAATGVAAQAWSLDRGHGIPFQAWVAGAAIFAATALVVCLRAARPAERQAVAVAAGRQGTATLVTRTGVDLLLTALAGVALWQAAESGLISSTANGRDIVLVAACAPASAIAAGAAIAARLASLGARIADRLAGNARRLPARLAAWELARTPLRYLAAALPCVAAVAGCGYATAQHVSWQRSVHDQAAFSVGADVSVALPQPLSMGTESRLARLPDVVSATPLSSTSESFGTLVGVDAKEAATTVALRSDLAPSSLPSMWSALVPDGKDGQQGDNGVVLPGRPVVVGISASLASPGMSPPDVTAVVEDATGEAYAVDLGRLSTDGAAHTLTATIASSGQVAYPLRVVSFALSYDSPALRDVKGTLNINELVARQAGAAAATVVGAGRSLGPWSAALRRSVACEDLEAAVPVDVITTPGADRSWVVKFEAGAQNVQGAACAETAGEGTITLSATSADTAIPGIATSAFLRATGLRVGGVTAATVNGATIRVHIVGSISAFPAAAESNASASALIVDIGGLSTVAAANDVTAFPTATWWLHTRNGRAPAGLPPGSQARTITATASALSHDPLAALPQRVLVVGAVTLVALALLGILVALAAGSRDATARDMVLSALGVTRRQRAALACILHAAVVVPAVLLGGVLGYVLAREFVPFYVLASDARKPFPPAAFLFDLPWSAVAAGVLVGVTLASAAVTAARRGDPLALARSGG